MKCPECGKDGWDVEKEKLDSIDNNVGCLTVLVLFILIGLMMKACS